MSIIAEVHEPRGSLISQIRPSIDGEDESAVSESPLPMVPDELSEKSDEVDSDD